MLKFHFPYKMLIGYLLHILMEFLCLSLMTSYKSSFLCKNQIDFHGNKIVFTSTLKPTNLHIARDFSWLSSRPVIIRFGLVEKSERMLELSFLLKLQVAEPGEEA